MDWAAAQKVRNLGCLGAAGLALSYAAYLEAMLRSHVWIVDAHGRPLVTDFLVFRVSGSLALQGAAVSAYNPYLQHQAQVAATHPFAHYLYWRYPPTYFFVAGALAMLPYVSAFLIWVATTLAAYAAAIAVVARTRIAFVVACGAPAIFINAISGQNGCLTAALIAGALLALEERPLVSGALLGFLAYKPQLALFFPIAFAAGGQWRALAAALATALLSVAASAAIFGDQTLMAFVRDLPNASSAVLVRGTNGWNNLQSLYGMARWLGMSGRTAWSAHIALVLSAGWVLVWLWRQPFSFAIKAAALALSCLLVSPYLYIYDFVVLSVPLAFLYRQCPFDAIEIAGAALANVCVGGFLFLPTPIGLAGAVIVGALIVRRAALSGEITYFLPRSAALHQAG